MGHRRQAAAAAIAVDSSDCSVCSSGFSAGFSTGSCHGTTSFYDTMPFYDTMSLYDTMSPCTASTRKQRGAERRSLRAEGQKRGARVVAGRAQPAEITVK